MNYSMKMKILKSGNTQIQIARETKIQESKLSKIVNGHIEPTGDEKKRIAKALNTTIQELFD